MGYGKPPPVPVPLSISQHIIEEKNDDREPSLVTYPVTCELTHCVYNAMIYLLSKEGRGTV